MLERDQELARTGRWMEIIDHWDAYLRTHPDDARAYYERAGAKQHAGHDGEALDDLRRSCELGFQHSCGIVQKVTR